MMKLYIGANSDGSEILSKRPLKRYIDRHHNSGDTLSYNDTQQPPHWMLDYTKTPRRGIGEAPIDVYLTLPTGSLKRMFGVELTWKDESKTIDL